MDESLLASRRRMRVCPSCRSIYTGEIEFCGLDGQRLVESDQDPLLGAVIGPYRIVQRLGEGGMGCVYRAEHLEIPKQVAVKVLFGDMAADKKMAERFRREAQSIARIDSRNVVQVLDYGTDASGLTYMLMELIEGQTLARAIAAQPGFPPFRTALILRQVALGLGAAHKLGMVHRDLKPGNIMLATEDGAEVAKILDFGLVSVAADPDDSGYDKLTKTGHTMGTPYYMSPEQLRGQPVTPRSDLYSLGAVAYEMIAGTAPFHGNVSEVLYKHAFEPPPPLPPASGLENVALKLLAKDPAHRYQSAEHLITEIERLGILPVGAATTGGFGVISLHPAAPATLGDLSVTRAVEARPENARWRLWVLLVCLILAAGMMSVFMLMDRDGGTELAPPPRLVRPAPVVEPPAPLADAGEASDATAVVVEPEPEAVPDAGVATVEPPPEPSRPKPPARPSRPRPSPPTARPTEPAKPAEPPKPTAPAAPSLAELERRVARLARLRGLLVAELGRVEGLEGSHAAWVSARAAGDAARALLAVEALETDIARATLPRELLDAALARARKALGAAGERLEPAELRKQEDRYLDFDERVRRAGPDERWGLLRELATWTDGLRQQAKAP